MNAVVRRRIVRENVLDVLVKTSISEARRQRADAQKKLRKALAATRFASSSRSDTISYPRLG